MWHDIETEIALLSFGTIAHAAADLIRSPQGTLLTTGVSGGWGRASSRRLQDVNSLFALYQSGALTREAFDEAKRHLLAHLKRSISHPFSQQPQGSNRDPSGRSVGAA